MSDKFRRPMHEPNDEPDSRRDRMRQAQWAKREAKPHAATCPRNGQLEGDRLDWLATDYPATQWPDEGSRG